MKFGIKLCTEIHARAAGPLKNIASAKEKNLLLCNQHQLASHEHPG
jgi:hypothetical protein